MSICIPYTRLFLRDKHSVVLTANGRVQVLDSSTGEVMLSTCNDPELSEKVQKSGEIVASAVDPDFKYLVTATSTKIVRTWNIAELRIVGEREAPKKPTDVCFTSDGRSILVSDKFGDVHRYPSQDTPTPGSQAQSGSSDSKAAKKRLEDETLILGHVSLLTTLVLSRDEKYIITADRDEHIRVSWYPEAYTIESYCLGHKKFVSALHIPSWDPTLLVSGGGDPDLKIWNWMEGKLLGEIAIEGAVMPFVKVVRRRSGRGEDGSDGEGQEGGPKTRSKGRRRGRRKRKGKEGAEGGSDGEVTKEDSPNVMQVDEQDAAHASTNNGLSEPMAEQGSSEPTPLLAVQKIATVEWNSQKLIIFSAYGASALFYCKFPDSTKATASEVRNVPLGKPVLDFALWPKGNEIWISVDANWSEVASPSSTSDYTEFVKVVKVSNNDEFILTDSSEHRSLAKSLNSGARFMDSFKDIDLYSALVALPKNIDAEHNAMDDEVLLSEAATQKLSGKELGRLKTKKAVLALQSAQTGKREQSEILDADRTLKRQKSEPIAEDG